ncbi:MAG TPA: histidine phosphatase family protein [Candidatus Paceibacterota bacterium]|nr:histidine phosphatase family protein [Candidatus Paceibacterota bacterium]
MAEPMLTALFGRHPETVANVDDANYGNQTPLTPKGERQAEHLRRWVKENRIEYIFHGPQDRCKKVFEGYDLGIPLEENPAFLERRRPSHTIGRKNDEVAEDLAAMVEHYGVGPARWDEEVYFESVDMVELGLRRILYVHETLGHRRFFCLTSGLRARMFALRAIHGGLDPEYFKQAYDFTGVYNAGIMELSYGPVFRKPDQFNWRFEFASNHYLPEELR